MSINKSFNLVLSFQKSIKNLSITEIINNITITIMPSKYNLFKAIIIDFIKFLISSIYFLPLPRFMPLLTLKVP